MDRDQHTGRGGGVHIHRGRLVHQTCYSRRENRQIRMPSLSLRPPAAQGQGGGSGLVLLSLIFSWSIQWSGYNFLEIFFSGDDWKVKPQKYLPPFVMWIVFETIAVSLWIVYSDIFYFINFSYIGTAIATGLILFEKKKKWARNMVQFSVGLYMLIYLGFLCGENMQIEGFWYYLFLGAFKAAVIHFAIAKIFGPLLFGRGWCGYACWTAMVLDLLPFKVPVAPRKHWGRIRYFVFGGAFLFVGLLFVLRIPNKEEVMWKSFIIGNILYYIVGISLAYKCKDNRAFCKYICPVTVFLKPMSYFSIFHIKVDKKKCISCGKCEKGCPMNVEVPSNCRKKRNATDCILCMKCVEECPRNALKL